MGVSSRMALALLDNNPQIRKIMRRVDVLVFAQVCQVNLHEWQLVIGVVDGAGAVHAVRFHGGVGLHYLQLGGDFVDGEVWRHFILSRANKRHVCTSSMRQLG